MARLKKDAWNKSSLRTKEIEVEDLGGSVLIRELPASVSADLSGLVDIVVIGREQRGKVDTVLMERREFTYGVVTDDGQPMFTEQEVEVIQRNHGRAFKLVVAAIDELSGVDKESLEKAEARFPSNGTAPDGSDVDDGPADSGAGPAQHVRASGTSPNDGPGDADG